MKSLLIKVAIVFLAFAVGSGAYLLTARRHAELWKKDNRARVFFNGQLSAGSAVYRRADVLSLVHSAEDNEWYVLGRRTTIDDDPLHGNRVGLESCGPFADRLPRFFTLRLPGHLYVWHYGAYSCAGDFDFDGPPAVAVGERSIEFNSSAGARIRVDW